MMTGLLLYSYCVGVFSSRKIERATYEDVGVRVLAGGSHPHFTTINQFRKEHQDALAGLFSQVLVLCRQAGLVTLGHVSVDGTKVLANASKHKAMSYERMKDDEKRLQREISDWMKRAEEADAAEDAKYGEGVGYEADVPAELRRREDRLKALRAAKLALEAEAAAAREAELRQNAAGQRTKAADESVAPRERRAAATRAKVSERQADLLARISGNDDDDDAPPPTGAGGSLPKHRVKHTPKGKPHGSSQRNFTDGDSRIMIRDGAFIQAYNAQVVVDSKAQIIVAEAVTNQPPDVERLQPLLNRVKQNCGECPDQLTADSGYFSQRNVNACLARKIDPYIAVDRQPHSPKKPARERRSSPAVRLKRWMSERLATVTGKLIYARRKTIVEPVFGQIKEARRFRCFSFRGLRRVRNEWSLVSLTHNLRKLLAAGAALLPA